MSFFILFQLYCTSLGYEFSPLPFSPIPSLSCVKSRRATGDLSLWKSLMHKNTRRVQVIMIKSRYVYVKSVSLHGKLPVGFEQDWEASHLLGVSSVTLTPLLSWASKIPTKENISFFGIIKDIPEFIQIFLGTELKSIINVGDGKSVCWIY